MTTKEYLSQGYRLEQRIVMTRKEIEYLQELACSVSSPGFEEHYNATRNTEAPYVKTVERILKMQDKETEKLNQLLSFRAEAKEVIENVDCKDECIVLFYRYFDNMKWHEIADALEVDERTVRRWHNQALSQVIIPDNPIIIDKSLGK